MAHKCAQHNNILGNICIASRRLDKANHILQNIISRQALKNPSGKLHAQQLNASNVDATKKLIVETRSNIVINAGPSFINIPILRACIETGAAYIDTAIHEEPEILPGKPPWYAKHEWQHIQECQDKNITAILGAGFDPGVVNAYAALAQREHFDSIESIDIFDVNAGHHGKYFSTNFNLEVNFRELLTTVWSWQNNQWQSNQTFEVKRRITLPIVGTHDFYLSSHDEIHSLAKNIPAKNIRFWMSFSDHYINVFNVLNNLGLLSTEKKQISGIQSIAPLQFIKSILPDPATLAPNYTGKTCIGNFITGKKDNKDKTLFIYNICDHQECYQEIGSQAIAYTAGVPAAATAILIAEGVWDIGHMVNVEELPHQPFLTLLDSMGLPTYISTHMNPSQPE